MMEDAFFRNNHWRKFEFHPDSIDSAVEQAAAWAEEFRQRFGNYQTQSLPWLRKPVGI
jgi:hypothetical protein